MSGPGTWLGASSADGAGPVELLARSLAPGQLARRLKEFLDRLPVGLSIVDAQGSPVYRNRVGVELIGLVQPGTRRGGYAVAHRLYRANTDTLYPDAELPVTRALAGEASVVDDLEVDHPHRGRVWLRAWGAPLLDADGRVAFAVVGFADVTVEKLLHGVFPQRVRALERERIAEGIHDDVLQLLAAARLQLDRPRPEAGGEPGNSTEAAKILVSEAALRLRLLLAGLKPRAADGLDLAEALRLSLGPLAAAGVEVHLEDRLGTALREPAGSTLRSVCEEAIANVVKHASPRRIQVALARLDGGVEASVVDDGIGFDPVGARRGGHLGMTLMEERVSRIGGRLRFDTSPDRGTAVRIWVPDPPQERAPGGPASPRRSPRAGATARPGASPAATAPRSPNSTRVPKRSPASVVPDQRKPPRQCASTRREVAEDELDRAAEKRRGALAGARHGEEARRRPQRA